MPKEATIDNETDAYLVLDLFMSQQVVEALQFLYPPRCLSPEETMADAHRYAGKVELVEMLAARARASINTPTTPKGLAQTDVHAFSAIAQSADAPADPGPNPPSGTSATAHATYTRSTQTQRRAGFREPAWGTALP